MFQTPTCHPFFHVAKFNLNFHLIWATMALGKICPPQDGTIHTWALCTQVSAIVDVFQHFFSRDSTWWNLRCCCVKFG